MMVFNLCGVYKAMVRTEGGGGVMASGRSRMAAISAALIKKEAVESAKHRLDVAKIEVECCCG